MRQNSLWDKIVLKKVRNLLGGRVRMIVTGSAPIAAHVLDFLRAAFGCQVGTKVAIFYLCHLAAHRMFCFYTNCYGQNSYSCMQEMQK